MNLFCQFVRRRRSVLLNIARITVNRSTQTLVSSLKMVRLAYPSVRRDVDFVENIHGVDVPDPYRWLENNDDEEVKQFCQEQQNLTISYIQEAANRSEIKEKLTDLFNYPKYGCPFKRGDNYFMFKNSGLQNQHVLYKFKNLDDEHQVFLDPNTFSSDGQLIANASSFKSSNFNQFNQLPLSLSK